MLTGARYDAHAVRIGIGGHVAGMTQRELAEKTGIDQAAISRIESGRANPTLNTLEALVEGVGSSLLVKIIWRFAPISAG